MLRLSRKSLLRGGGALVATKLFAPSIIKSASAGFVLGKAAGGGGYISQAVHFAPGDTYQNMFNGLIGEVGNFDCALFNCWIANFSPVDLGNIFVYLSDDVNAGFYVNQGGLSDFAVISYDDPAGSRSLAAEDGVFLLPIVPWTNICISARRSTQTLQCLVNGVQLGFAMQNPIWGPGTGFGNSTGDTWSIFGSFDEFDAADMYFGMSNTFFDLTNPANFAKFNAAGKPANPTGFSAGSWLTFTNGATGWTDAAAAYGLTVGGTLTNATTSPSD